LAGAIGLIAGFAAAQRATQPFQPWPAGQLVRQQPRHGLPQRGFRFQPQAWLGKATPQADGRAQGKAAQAQIGEEPSGQGLLTQVQQR
jgi:hypothetical protein